MFRHVHRGARSADEEDMDMSDEDGHPRDASGLRSAPPSPPATERDLEPVRVPDDTGSRERRAAARLLGQLQVPQALGALKDIIDNDPDVLLRRAAASSLRQLQTPESIPVMERLLDEISFDAPNRGGQTVSVAAADVNTKLGELAKDEDLSRYIL